MVKLILSDWDTSHNSNAHYKLEPVHKSQLEEKLSMKVVKYTEFLDDDQVYFYWGNKFRMSYLNNFKNLQWVHLGSSGTDNIKLSDLSDKKIKLTTSRGLYSDHVAEYLLSMVLLSSKIPFDILFDSDKNNRRYIQETQKLPSTFQQLRILIFGTGLISEKFISLLKYLNAQVDCVSISGRQGFKSVHQLDQTKSYSHVISLLPLKEKTINYFNFEVLRTVCKDTVFINCGRGQTVDHTALTKALDNNFLKGAILDTHIQFDGDCKDLGYCKHPRIFCTPHIASWSTQFSEIQFNFLINEVEKII